jgi:hypothetical protein
MESMIAEVGANERGFENSKSDCTGMVAGRRGLSGLVVVLRLFVVEFLDVGHWSLVGGFAGCRRRR